MNPQISSSSESYKVPCLLFSFADFLYGIDSTFVQEILELPELKCPPGLPDYFAGICNYKNEILPVIDVRVCLGYTVDHYNLTDVLVVLQEDGKSFGLLTPEMQDIHYLPLVKKSSFTDLVAKPLPALPILAKTLELQNTLVFFLDTHLIWQTLHDVMSQHQAGLAQAHQSSVSSIFEAKIKAEEQHIFKERAQILAEGDLQQERAFKSLISLTLLRIHQQLFAVESTQIKELCYIGEFSPIPGTQSSLIGFMNLRGNILPLLDSGFLLHKEPILIQPSSTKVIVVDSSWGSLGLLVDEVVQILSVDTSTIYDLTETGMQEKFTTRTFRKESQIIGIMDIKQLLQVFTQLH